MALVTDLLDRLTQLEADKAPWLQHWYEIARFALPDAERFDRMFMGPDKATAIDTVVSEPVAAKRGREIYDTTSLWAIDRGAAGTLSLVTPQTGTWHDLVTDDPFGGAMSDEEEKYYQRLRDYLFAVRGNPRSGFWSSHKSALRCMWAFGTSVMAVLDSGQGNPSLPISYRFIPISENNLGTNYEGVVDTNFRLYTRSARQCVERWGTKVSAKTQTMADDPKQKDKAVTILHAVMPRAEKGSYGNTNRDAPFASCYIEVQEKTLLSESGFWEFPYRVDYWQRNTNQPFAEGPIAYALADIKSLNLLAKTELRAAQQAVDPPLATQAEPGNRLNLNPRAVNPGYIGSRGELLAQPILTARPDFAQAVLEVRRQQIRTTLYIDLWTTIIDSERQMTAYEAALRNQERADMIGPIGTSLQAGLSFMVERELGILERLGAFMPGSPLEPPESLAGRNVGTRFSSPLDRARRYGEVQAAQQVWALAAEIAEADPSVIDKLDADATLDLAQEVLGAPRRIFVGDDVLAARREARAGSAQQAETIQSTAAAGVAAQESAAGAEALAASPTAQAILQQLAGVAA